MLVEAVESVAGQHYPRVELLVVDDHSETPAERVMADREYDDVAIRHLRHDRNQGANAARKTGIAAARGEYLAFLDDDDRWNETKLEKQVAVARDTGAGLITCGQEYVNEEGWTTGYEQPTVDGDVTADFLGGEPPGTFSTVLVSQAAIEEAGPPDDAFPCWQDLEWFVRLSQHTAAASVREPLVVRQMGTHDQISDDFAAKRDVAYPLFLEKHRDLAARLDCESAFRASMAAKIAGSALATGHYAETVRFSIKALRADPTLTRATVYILLALGGDFTYRPAIFLKRYISGVTARV